MEPGESEDDETKVVAKLGFLSLNVRPGNQMPQKVKDAFHQATQIVDNWMTHHLDQVFDWELGDFSNGELQYDGVTAHRLDTIPAGEKLLRFTMFLSAGRALAIRPSGDLVEFEVKFIAIPPKESPMRHVNPQATTTGTQSEC